MPIFKQTCAQLVLRDIRVPGCVVAVRIAKNKSCRGRR